MFIHSVVIQNVPSSDYLHAVDIRLFLKSQPGRELYCDSCSTRDKTGLLCSQMVCVNHKLQSNYNKAFVHGWKLILPLKKRLELMQREMAS